MSSSDTLFASTEPAFPKLLREALGRRKYARWAENLTEDQLMALFTAIGGMAEEAFELIEVLRRHTPKEPYPYAKALAGLEAVGAASLGCPLSQQEFHEKLIPALKKAMAEFKSRQEKDRKAGNIL